MEEEKEKNFKTYKNIRKFSTIAFVISVILLINLFIILHIGDTIHYYMYRYIYTYNRYIYIAPAILSIISQIFLLPILILYFFFSSVYAYIKCKKIPYINIISIVLICALYILRFTGFCFEDIRYWSKAELIDKVLNSYIIDNCYTEYRVKHGNTTDKKYEDIIKECSISLESVKQEAPQCFTMFRPNRCRGNVTHFDKKTNSYIKSEIEVYKYSKYGRYFFYFEYLRFNVESELNINPNMNDPIIGCCGTMQGPGMWD